MIDAVLFDLGQVLVRWDPYLPYAGRFDRGEVEAFFTEIDFPAFNHAQDAGRPWAVARAEIARSHPHRLGMLDCYVDHFDDAVPGPVPGAEELVSDVLAAGVRAYGLTNWSAETFPVASRTAPVVDLLQGVLVSGAEGVAKPDPRIYAIALERFALDPAGTLFVDDSAVNVRAARAAGLHAELFTTHEDLRRALRGYGLAFGC